MDKAILLAIAASVCTATASLCQRKGAKSTQTAGFDARLLVRLARQPAWLLGIAAMIGGFIFQITALRYGNLALVQPILAAELLFVFGYLAIAGTRRVTGRDLLAAAALSAGLGVFLRLAAPSSGRLHASGSSWLLAGLVTASLVVAALTVACGLGRLARRAPGPPRRRARRGHRDLLGIHGRGHQGTQLAPRRRPRRHRFSVVAVRAPGRRSGDHAAGLARAGGRPAGRLPARVHHLGPADGQPARRVPVRRAHPDQCGRPGRRSAGAGRDHRRRRGPQPQLPNRRRDAPAAGQHQAAPSSAASSAPATRPTADPADQPVPGSCQTRRPAALSPDVAARAGRTRPGPAPAAARTGPPGPARGNQDPDPVRAAA